MFPKLSLRTVLVVACLCVYLSMAWGKGYAVNEMARDIDIGLTIRCTRKWATVIGCIYSGGGLACLAAVPEEDECYQWLRGRI